MGHLHIDVWTPLAKLCSFDTAHPHPAVGRHARREHVARWSKLDEIWSTHTQLGEGRPATETAVALGGPPAAVWSQIALPCATRWVRQAGRRRMGSSKQVRKRRWNRTTGLRLPLAWVPRGDTCVTPSANSEPTTTRLCKCGGLISVAVTPEMTTTMARKGPSHDRTRRLSFKVATFEPTPFSGARTWLRNITLRKVEGETYESEVSQGYCPLTRARHNFAHRVSCNSCVHVGFRNISTSHQFHPLWVHQSRGCHAVLPGLLEAWLLLQPACVLRALDQWATHTAVGQPIGSVVNLSAPDDS